MLHFIMKGRSNPMGLLYYWSGINSSFSSIQQKHHFVRGLFLIGEPTIRLARIRRARTHYLFEKSSTKATM